MDPVWTLLIGAAVNGLVTFGVIKATLRHHAEGIKEAKAIGVRAHHRIDDLMLAERERA